MEIYPLTEDLKVFRIKAKSFPEGVLEAHQSLHKLVPNSSERSYFGISHPQENGQIQYWAAMNELSSGELAHHNLDPFLIKKGNYLYQDIQDFMKNISAIGQAFTKLIHDNRIDPEGACIEWYLSDDVCRCMVRLKD